MTTSTDRFTVTHDFVHATPEQVWEQWTVPAKFARWWGTTNVDVPLDTVQMDVRPGGDWRAQMRMDDGAIIDWTGSYTEVGRPNRLGFTLTNDEARDVRAQVDVRIEPSATEGVTMTLTQSGSGMDEEQTKQTVAGYEGFFRDLEACIESQ